MESQHYEEETDEACEEQFAYGAHQEYGPDGNYDDSSYAMSASAESNHFEGYHTEDDNEETYAS